MTPRAEPKLSPKKIALVHVARRDLGLAEGEYRAILKAKGAVDSAGNLDERGFRAVMSYMTSLGFRSDWTKRTYGERPGMASPAQVELVRALWRQAYGDDENDASLNAWLGRFHKVSALRFVDERKAAKVISALKAINSRSKHQI